MPDTAREIAAYAIIGLVLVAAVTTYFTTRDKRRRAALRRRGVKTFER